MIHPTPKLRRVRRSLARWMVVALITALVAWSWQADARRRRIAEAGPEAERGVVRRVIDGDTVDLADGRRVRLLGVDTPETKHPDQPVERGGPEATAWMTERVAGRAVRLEFDRERLDRYGRWLAYLFAEGEPADRAFVNVELVRAGWSKADLRFPLRASYKRLLRDAEGEARAAGRGLWSESLPDRASRGVR